METSCDFETRSACDLKKAGAYHYAEHPSTDVWCFAFWSPAQSDILLWEPPQYAQHDPLVHAELLELAKDPSIVFRAWNAPFERVIWRHIMARYGFPDIPLERWVCTAAEARAMGLPNKLEDAARVLAGQQKDLAGHRLMLQMAKPRQRITDLDGNETGYVWWDADDKRQRLGGYCVQDVRTEQDIAGRIQRLQPPERAMWLLDQRANDRGILADLGTARAAVAMSERVTKQANKALAKATDGAVQAITSVPRYKAWLSELLGVAVESLSKRAVTDLLNNPDLPRPAREALELRLENGKSSVKKVQAILNAACDDGALRGLLLYWGAGTGRWAGRLVQPQNFPARTAGLPEWFVMDLQDRPEAFIDKLHQGDLEGLEFEGPPLEIIALLLRSMLIARPGKLLFAADYSAIEARVVAWLTGVAWRLEVFRTHGKIYEASASTMFGIPFEDFKAYKASTGHHHPARQKGKVAELALGFLGGPKALVTMGAYDMGLDDSELPDIVARWRAASPEIVQAGKQLQKAALDAVRSPGRITEALGGKVRFKVSGGFLWLRLPSGRRLAYCKPHIVQKPAPWDPETMLDNLHAWSVDNKTKRWSKRSLWSGLLLENITQAVARDIMAAAMMRLEQTGRYDVLLTVHDEIVTEADPGRASAKELVDLMCTLPDWAAGLPIAADAGGYPSNRYKK